ncbi:MAG TPA: biotin--[acetyl-CoA-carboxylase] ligase [Chthoniobacterales bacterium]|nr:biotin--[acetyl-CoA-carboxylase] ligase [Chthoniobacterales bacterium]
MSPPDRLSAAELRAPLGENVIGSRVIVLESTRSTNDFLLQMLTPELPEGFVVFAEHQTAGRGQRGNSWASAAHRGLWFSLLLRPQFALAESARLTNWAAEAIAATIAAQTTLKPTIKPPNDVYLEGRKVAGVLVETQTKKGRIENAIVGLGINLNQAAEDFPLELRGRASSLFIAGGRLIDRTAFAVALLRELNLTLIPSGAEGEVEGSSARAGN